MKRILSALAASVAVVGAVTTSAQASDQDYFISTAKQISAFYTTDIRVVCPGNYPNLVAGAQQLIDPPDGIQLNRIVVGALEDDPLKREYAVFNITNNWNTYAVVEVGTWCRK